MDEVCHNVMFIFGGREGGTSVDSVCLHTGQCHGCASKSLAPVVGWLL